MARRLRIHHLTGILLLVLAVLSPTIIHGRATTSALSMAAPTGSVGGVATEPQRQGAVQQAGGADGRNVAADGSVASVEAVAAAATITVSPTTVAPGALITTTVANGPGIAGDWVGLHLVNGADSSYLQWKYLNGTTTQPATGLTGATVTFTAPAMVGDYQLRWFSNNTYARLATSATITVSAAAQPTVTVSPTLVAVGGTLTVTLANGPGAAGDWVGLNAVNGPDTSYVQWKYLNGTTTQPATGLTARR